MACERVFQTFQDAFPDASDNNIFEAQPTAENLSDFLHVVDCVSRVVDKKCAKNIRDIISKLEDIQEERGNLPDKPRRACSRLFSKLAANAPWSEISDAFLPILALTPSSLALDTHRKEDSNESALSGVIGFLQQDWKLPYYPDSLDALKDYIQHYERAVKAENVYYGKIVTFIQSSGMGKSRLVDAFGEECPMINLVLRKEGSTGYPPPDSEIVSLVTRQAVETQQSVIDNSPSSKGRGGNFSKKRRTVVWNHSLAMGLVQACLEKFSAWVDLQISHGIDSLERLAVMRHHEMALPTAEGQIEEGSDLRSGLRIDFCRSVAGRARDICDELVLNAEWRALFNSDQESSVRQTLSDSHSTSLVAFHSLAEQLNKKLESLAREDSTNSNGPYLAFAFDEAATFLEQETSDSSPGRLVAIHRIISLLKGYKIWFFFISTESKIQHMFPPDIADRTDNYAHDPSERRIHGGDKLLRLPPFVALPLDIGVRRKMRDAKAREVELRKPFSEIMNINHLAMYGRPLWMAYTQIPQELYSLASGKLLGGIKGSYRPYDKFHVFAALSFRLTLDVCVQNPRAISLNRTAVDSHMRVVISVDPFSGAMDTISPSEPVLAEAAMKHLCDGKNWEMSVHYLCKELLEGGCIEKGIKGELFARWVVILASDAIRSKCLMKTPRITTSFTVEDFLMSLYDEKYQESIALIDPQILQGKMNFSHFVPAGENLYPKAILPLCHELLRRGAAMQLAPGQPTYDQLIPYYCGENDEPFDESKCGAILIQVKYKAIATSPQAIFGEPFTSLGASSAAQPQGSRKPLRDGPYFVFEGFKRPLLFLLFDLGAKVNKRKKPKAVQFSLSDNRSPPIWAIHSKGHGPQVFGCISTMRCADKSDLLFLQTTPAGSNLHDQLALSNNVFANIDPKAYFPNADGLRKRLRSSEDDAGRE